MKITNTQQTGIAGRMAGNVPAGGVVISDPGGVVGGGPLTLEEFIALYYGSGIGPFLTKTGAEGHTKQDHDTLGATPVFDLGNANVHLGELAEDSAGTIVGWPADSGYTRLSVTGDGSSTLTLSGVTWIGTAPGIIDAGDVLHIAVFSDDAGTTQWGAVVGGGGGAITAADLAALGVVGAIVMTPGITNPPEPVWTPDGTDYVYEPLG